MDIRKKDRLNSFMKCIYNAGLAGEEHKVFYEDLIDKYPVILYKFQTKLISRNQYQKLHMTDYSKAP